MDLNPIINFIELIITGIIAGIVAAIVLNYLPEISRKRAYKKFQRDVNEKASRNVIFDDASVLESYLVQAAHNRDYNRVVEIITIFLKEFNKLDLDSWDAIVGKLQKFGIHFSEDDYIIDRFITTAFIFFYKADKRDTHLFRRYEKLFLILAVLLGQTSESARNEVGIFLCNNITPDWLANEGNLTKIRYISLLCHYAATISDSSYYRINQHLMSLIESFPEDLVEYAFEYDWKGQGIATHEELMGLKAKISKQV